MSDRPKQESKSRKRLKLKDIFDGRFQLKVEEDYSINFDKFFGRIEIFAQGGEISSIRVHQSLDPRMPLEEVKPR